MNPNLAIRKNIGSNFGQIFKNIRRFFRLKCKKFSSMYWYPKTKLQSQFPKYFTKLIQFPLIKRQHFRPNLLSTL